MTVVCGIYQAYWCFGAVLLLTVCFIDYLRGKLDFNNFFKNAFLYILNLVLSLGLYYIITILIHKVTGISFSSYQDMDKIGKFNSVKEIYWYAREAYYQFLKFFFINGGFVSDKRQVILNIIIAVIVLILMTSCFYSKKRRWYESGFFYIVLLLIPLAVNVLSVISRNRLWPVMMIAFIIPYMLAILCCEHMVFLKCVWLRKSIVFICCISIGITAYMNYLTTNRIYLRMDLAYEATYAYLVKLTMRLEDCPDYQHDMPVSFINESDIIEKNQLNQIRFFEVDYPEEMSVFDDLNGMRDVDARTMIRNELDIVDFCQAFLGFKLVIIPNEERLKLYENREVQRMPVYPTEGSIKKINNQIVVKLPG